MRLASRDLLIAGYIGRLGCAVRVAAAINLPDLSRCRARFLQKFRQRHNMCTGKEVTDCWEAEDKSADDRGTHNLPEKQASDQAKVDLDRSSCCFGRSPRGYDALDLKSRQKTGTTAVFS